LYFDILGKETVGVESRGDGNCCSCCQDEGRPTGRRKEIILFVL
jgi:hypothetical protein